MRNASAEKIQSNSQLQPCPVEYQNNSKQVSTCVVSYRHNFKKQWAKDLLLRLQKINSCHQTPMKISNMLRFAVAPLVQNFQQRFDATSLPEHAHAYT